MNDKQTLAALKNLHAIERFSLANYLRYAKPWVSAADQCLCEAVRRIGNQQLEFSDRVGALIIERRGHVDGGSFPFRFTAYNDLSVAYLAPRVMEDQEQIVRQVRAIAHQLHGDAVACDLVNEILGAEEAHLDSLRELLSGQESEPCRKSAVASLGEERCKEHVASVATAA